MEQADETGEGAAAGVEGARRVIDTPRLRLRPFRAGDEAAYAAIRAEPAVARHLPGGEAGAAEAEATAARLVPAFAALWESPPFFGPWAAVRRETGALIGHLGLRRLPEFGGRVELLYALAPAAQGRGLALEGARAAVAFGFRDLGLKEISALALPANAPSLRLMDRLGMTRAPGLVEVFGLSLVHATLAAPAHRAG